MKVTFLMRLDEGLRRRLEERASMERRSLASLIERLLELGLGQMVEGREAGVALSGSARDGGEVGSNPAPVSRPSTICSREKTHGTSNSRCPECGWLPTQSGKKTFQPDFKPGTKV